MKQILLWWKKPSKPYHDIKTCTIFINFLSTIKWLLLLTSFHSSLASFSTNMSICHFLAFCHEENQTKSVWNWLLWKESFKNCFTPNMVLFDPFPHVTLRQFSSTHHSFVSFTKKWQTVARNRRRFFSISVDWSYYIISTMVRKVRNASLTQSAGSLSRTDVHVFTNHVGKIVEL